VDRHRRLIADTDGDGHSDVVYVHPRNPGYQVFIARGKAGGGYATPEAKPIANETELAGLAAPAIRWMPMDAGGPGGHRDGKTDLVLVDQGRVYTLLSTGDGWEAKRGETQVTANTPQRWRPASVDGDGGDDLVRFDALKPGVRIAYLRSNGDGTWTPGHQDLFTTNQLLGSTLIPALDVPQVWNFLSTDLGGDGRTDFVLAQAGEKTRLRVLASNGDGTWTPRTDDVPHATTDVEAHQLTPMEYNGDASTDLALVRAGGCASVTAFVSTGSGWQVKQPQLEPCPAAPADVSDTGNLRWLDINADGRWDAVHLSRLLTGDVSTTTAQILLNRAKSAWPRRGQSLATPFPDSWSFQTADVDGDGRSELVRLDDRYSVLRWQARGPDELTRIDNGRGAITTVDYRPLVGGRRNVPAGAVPRVVASTTTTDATSVAPVTDTLTVHLHGATWSDRRRSLLGFERIVSRTASSITDTAYHLSEACGARVASESRMRSDGTVLARTTRVPVPAGAAAPFTCLPETSTAEVCEGKATCTTTSTTLEYDRFGNIISSSDGDLRVTSTDFRPNPDAYIVSLPARRQVHDADQALVASTEHHYDSNTTWDAPPGEKGQLRATREWNDHTGDHAVRTFDYDARGNQIKAVDSVGVWTTTEYDSVRSLYPVKRCTRIGCAHETWHPKGVLENRTDLNGRVTSYQHDAFGRVTLETRSDGSTTRTQYLDGGRRTRTEVSDGSPKDGVRRTEEVRDGLGRVVLTRAEADAETTTVTETLYLDASERPWKRSSPHRAGSTTVWTEFRYDALGRPTKTLHPDGTARETIYEKPGETRTRDETGRETVTYTDVYGRKVRVDEVGKSTAITRYTYDALDRVKTTTDAEGHVRVTDWDSLGRKIGEDDPDRGVRSWTWRADGTPESSTDARGQTITWDYDESGRMTERRERDAHGDETRTATWHWDRNPATNQTQGDSLGRIVRSEHSSRVASGSMTKSYDALGRVTQTRQCVDERCADLHFGFDVAGRLRSVSYPDATGHVSPASETVSYAYDDGGRLQTVTRGDGMRYALVAHNALGQLERLEHSNGLAEQLHYDPQRHWLERHTIEPQSPARTAPLFDGTYRHNPDGTLRTATERTPSELAQSYEYDDLGRLKTVTASDPSRNRAYEVDKIGRIRWSSSTGERRYGDPDHAHAVTDTDGGHTRSYDANGDLVALDDPGTRTARRSLTLDWTAGGMPETVRSGAGTTRMAYDADDQRVVKRGPAGTTSFFGRYVEADAAGKFTKLYWAGERLIGRRDAAGALTTIHQDRLSSTRLLANSTGQAVERFDYDPFGALVAPVSRDERLWNGELRDTESGLVYMNARYYDPAVGQFISADSVIPDLYAPQSLNRYSYNYNTPINYIDPSGNRPQSVDVNAKSQGGRGFAAGFSASPTDSCVGACPPPAPLPLYVCSQTSGANGTASPPQGVTTPSVTTPTPADGQSTQNQSKAPAEEAAAQPDAQPSRTSDGFLPVVPTPEGQAPPPGGPVGSIGVSASVQLGLGGEIGIGWVWDGSGASGLLFSPAMRMGPDIGAGVSVTASLTPSAKSIHDMKGPGFGVVIDTPAGRTANLQMSIPPDPHGDPLIGVGGGVGVGPQMGISTVSPYSFLLQVFVPRLPQVWDPTYWQRGGQWRLRHPIEPKH
jgi:RHS repeat-associated protein